MYTGGSLSCPVLESALITRFSSRGTNTRARPAFQPPRAPHIRSSTGIALAGRVLLHRGCVAVQSTCNLGSWLQRYNPRPDPTSRCPTTLSGSESVPDQSCTKKSKKVKIKHREAKRKRQRKEKRKRKPRIPLPCVATTHV